MKIVRCPKCGSGDARILDISGIRYKTLYECRQCGNSWTDIPVNDDADDMTHKEMQAIAKNATNEPDYPQAKEDNEYRYLSPRWIDAMAYGLTDGQRRYPGQKWKEIPAHEHAWRAIRHLMLYLAGDKKDTHLVNASMRCMMAFETDKAANDTIEWERLMREKGCG